MKSIPGLMQTLSLSGLVPAAPQQCGAVRLVPLLRRQVRGDLRLALQRYREPLSVVAIDGKPDGGRPDGVLREGLKYIGYIPHGLVVSYSEDGSPIASMGSQLCEDGPGRGGGRSPVRDVRLLHRMVKRESGSQLRFLPLHLAMEGFLALHFGGPEIAWSEYSRQALRDGLSPRGEWVMPGRGIAALEEALRIFEIHESQCGVLLCVADALASVFVVPSPADYRALHSSLIEDFYGDLIAQYSHLYRQVPELQPAAAASAAAMPKSLDEMHAWLAAVRSEWATIGQVLCQGLDGRRVHPERLYRLGPFVLQRFLTGLQLDGENHIGEAIVRDDGTVEYLKSFRLSDKQVKRAYLLQILSHHHWNLDAAAASQHQGREQFAQRLVNAGFGYLLSEPVLRAARKR